MPALPETNYPQFRRYKTGTSWFRINSPTQYEEIRKMGSRWFIDRYEVKILPDRNWVYDLTFAYQDFAEAITQEEYQQIFRNLSS
ncbi:MAG: hypothetical protein MUC87_11600 [Bacteroidia bacterium]|jgi:hypothetical protein|nr:hypothetical protein [Bacteroidia bacterium]